VNAELPTVV